MEGEVASATLAQSLGTLAVLVAAVALAVLPALVALTVASGGLTSVATAAGVLVALLGGGKFAVVAWGIASAGLERPGFRAASAPFD
jgi:hypothetical protein